MGAPPDPTGNFTDLLASMFSDMREKHRSAIEKQIDIQQGLLEQYRQSIARERSNDADAFQAFTKMTMATFMSAAAMQREARMHLLDLHTSLADAHLAFLSRMKETLAQAAAEEQPAGKNADARSKTR